MTKRWPIATITCIVVCSQLLVAQESSRSVDRQAAAESYLRSGLDQAQKKRAAYLRVCEEAEKEFKDAQAMSFKIVRPPVTADGKPVFGYGGSPVNKRMEKGKELAEFYRKDDRDLWVRNLHEVFQQRVSRYNQLPDWEIPILDIRNANVGDCGHLLKESEVDLISKYGIGSGSLSGGFGGYGGEGEITDAVLQRRQKTKPVIEDTQRPAEYNREKERIAVTQILTKESFIATIFNTDVFVEGIDTSRLTDNAVFSTDEIFLVYGTKDYTTVLGAKRTLLAIKIASDDSSKYIKEYVKRNRPTKVEYGLFRDWTHAKGDVLASGMFRKKVGSSVLIVDRQGQETKIDMTQLSTKDRQFLKDISN